MAQDSDRRPLSSRDTTRSCGWPSGSNVVMTSVEPEAGWNHPIMDSNAVTIPT